MVWNGYFAGLLSSILGSLLLLAWHVSRAGAILADELFPSVADSASAISCRSLNEPRQSSLVD